MVKSIFERIPDLEGKLDSSTVFQIRALEAQRSDDIGTRENVFGTVARDPKMKREDNQEYLTKVANAWYLSD